MKLRSLTEIGKSSENELFIMHKATAFAFQPTLVPLMPLMSHPLQRRFIMSW